VIEIAGRGPRPKDVDRLAGHGAAKARAAGTSVFVAERVAQPPLPVLYVPGKAGRKVRFAWPAATKRWWANWGSEPLSEYFRPTDWDFLADTALIHARVWGAGDLSMMNELRLRVAKMGATAEDRARLRITYASADDDADEPQQQRTAESGDETDEFAGFPRLVGG
jgi:hypothetical protein